MAIKIQGTTVIDDSRNLTNVGGVKTVGGQSILGSGDIEVGGNLIDKPTITTPSNGQTNYNGGYASSAFSSVDSFTGTQDRVEWQLASDSGFSNIVDSVNSTNSGFFNSWSTSQDSGALTTYYVRVRYHSDSHVSEWSDAVSYTTPNIYVVTPTITNPADGATNQPAEVTFTTSAFSIANGSDTHVSSDWQLSTTSNFSNIIYQSIGNTSNKTSNTIAIPNAQVSTTYYLRVRHNSANYSSSAYATVSFTTTASFAGEIAYTSPGTYTWTAPAGVTSVNVVAVGSGHYGNPWNTGGGGLGYKNNISVQPGSSYTVNVNDNYSMNSGTASYFINEQTVAGYTGSDRTQGGTFVGDGGGNGGTWGSTSGGGGGSGGAGGYSGNGGPGGSTGSGGTGSGAGGVGIFVKGNTGSGGGNGSPAASNSGGGGGGGAQGSGVGEGGSGGSDGQNNNGGAFGGGCGWGGQAAGGAVRIVWGQNRTFPDQSA
jgi:hypothetical protein